MPKATTPTSGRRRHNPLEQDILAAGLLRNKPSKRPSNRDEDADRDHFVDSKASSAILRIGRELAEEEEEHQRQQKQPAAAKGHDGFAFDARPTPGAGAEVEDVYGDDDAWADEDEEVEEIEVDVLPDDLDTFNKFLSAGDEDPILNGVVWEPGPEEQESGERSRNLADIILAKIAAHEAAGGPGREAAEPEEDYELPPKVVEVYTQIGMMLSRYKSGKLPKPFKILPTLPHWEDIMEVTKPDAWTTNACYEATRIFVSAKPVVAQRFMEMVLLPRVREDIYETKKLNVHLFNALKKGLYKPSAWFKGFLFPLVSSGTCSLREAHIVAAVLSRISVPVLHSAAAIKGLCDIAAEEASQGESSGATNLFVKTLLEKKYALPYQVIDALVFHFLRFRAVDPASVKRGDAMTDFTGEGAPSNHKLPVIWHQCLLAFAQRYRNDISEDQREALLDLLLTHGHAAIGPEVRRELLAGRGRGVPVEPQGVVFDGDDTMVVDS